MTSSPPLPAVAILDDIFPHPLSAFRYEEFVTYLTHMPECAIYSTGVSLALVKDGRSLNSLIADLFAHHPQCAGRVHPLAPNTMPVAETYYAIFLNNIIEYVATIERLNRPFTFTLYPGGGFQIGDATSDAKLERVLASPQLKHVLVTQPVTETYLREKFAFDPNRLTFISGGVMPRSHFTSTASRTRWQGGSQEPRIGFVANRYTPGGLDKGYDLFLATAQALTAQGINASYHIVGPWTQADGAIDANIRDRLTFHGYLSTTQLQQLSRTLDILLSPNRPSQLAPGAFDGFPTGSAIEAGLQGAAVVCTDELNLNTLFEDGRNIVLVRPEVDHIVAKLRPLLSDPSALAKLGDATQEAFRAAYSPEAQMAPRLDMLNRVIAEAQAGV